MTELEARKDGGGPAFDRLSPVRSRSVVDLVLAQLEGLFVANAFRPGQRLNEVALSQAMAVSRSSLREAARKLEQRGWLVSRPNHGFFVRSFTEAEMTQIYEARFCLEAFAVRTRLAGLEAAGLRLLQRHFDALRRTAARKEEAVIGDRILAFHRAVVALTENQILLDSFDSLAMDTKLMMSLIGGVQANPGEAVQRNRPILEALLARDAAAGEAALEYYLTRSLAGVVAFLRKTGQSEATARETARETTRSADVPKY